MAKIEMDLSEYQEIQKVNRLLEESLEKERKLQEEVNKLKQENIDTLKANEKVVTIVERIDSVDTIRLLQPEHIILRNIKSLVLEGSQGYNFDGGYKTVIEKIADAFFKVERQELRSQDKSVSTKGLDQVTKEIEDRLDIEIKGNYVDRIKLLTERLEKAETKLKKSEPLEKANKLLIKHLENFKTVVEEQKERLEAANIQGSVLNEVKQKVYSTTPTIFNSVKTIKIIKNFLKANEK